MSPASTAVTSSAVTSTAVTSTAVTSTAVTSTAVPSAVGLVDRWVAQVPSRDDVHRRLSGLADRAADLLGVPARDVHVLAGALAVAASLFSVSLVATASPEPGPVRQLEAQHQQWLQEVSAPAATVVD